MSKVEEARRIRNSLSVARERERDSARAGTEAEKKKCERSIGNARARERECVRAQ